MLTAVSCQLSVPLSAADKVSSEGRSDQCTSVVATAGTVVRRPSCYYYSAPPFHHWAYPRSLSQHVVKTWDNGSRDLGTTSYHLLKKNWGLRTVHAPVSSQISTTPPTMTLQFMICSGIARVQHNMPAVISCRTCAFSCMAWGLRVTMLYGFKCPLGWPPTAPFQFLWIHDTEILHPRPCVHAL